jgi:hypothetical protein
MVAMLQTADAQRKALVLDAPKGMGYQWEVINYWENRHMVVCRMAELGWEPVPSERHPEFKSNRDGDVITNLGRTKLILFERPMSVVRAAGKPRSARSHARR